MLMRLRSSRKGFTLIELMMVVAILAILAVVAVPAFIKYMRRAKTTEAIDQLDKVYKGAATYYTTTRVKDTAFTRLPCQFPVTVGATPNVGSCCEGVGPDTNGDDRCDSNPDLWTDATWNSLLFQITDEHYFIYDFTSTGTLKSAKFTAGAYADLDCDTQTSTFKRAAFGDPQATRGECSIVGSPAFYVENETE